MPTRPRRRALRRAAAIAASAVTLVTTVGLTAPTEAQAATTYTVRPGADLTAAFTRLRAGDTLQFAPGTYNIGTLRPALARGTASARITVKAQDMAHKPLLQGWLRLERPYYWSFSGLRVQATLKDHEAIDVFGGHYWSIGLSEIFGARQTGAFANIAVYTYGDTATCGQNAAAAGCENPYGWSILSSCIHDASTSLAAGHGTGTNHNIYLTGNGYAPGTISRNIIYSAPYGSEIKIGQPSPYSGFTGVTVDHNTLHGAGQGVLVSGDGINRTTIRYNLIKSMAPPTNNVGSGIYLNAPGRNLRAGEVPNYVVHNYGQGIKTSTLYQSYSSSKFPDTFRQGDNPTLNTAAAEPRFDSGGCGGYHPANPVAARYGRYGTYFGSGF